MSSGSSAPVPLVAESMIGKGLRCDELTAAE